MNIGQRLLIRDELDLQIMTEGMHFIRKMAATSPLKDVIGMAVMIVIADAVWLTCPLAREINPGPLVEPGNDEQMRSALEPAHNSSSQ